MPILELAKNIQN